MVDYCRIPLKLVILRSYPIMAKRIDISSGDLCGKNSGGRER